MIDWLNGNLTKQWIDENVVLIDFSKLSLLLEESRGVGKVCRMFLGLCSEIAADTTLNMMDDRGLPRHYSIRHPSLLLLSNLSDAAQMPNPRWWRPGHQGFHFNTWSCLATFSILLPTHFFSHNFLIKPTCFFNFRVIKPI